MVLAQNVTCFLCFDERFVCPRVLVKVFQMCLRDRFLSVDEKSLLRFYKL